MGLAEFFATLLNMTVPGVYLSLIIMFILHMRRRIKGQPALTLATQALHLALWTGGVTVVLTIVVWLLVAVLSMDVFGGS